MITRLALPIGLGLLLLSSVAAQTLPSGKWTGSVKTAADVELAVAYDVASSGDSVSILIRTPDRGDYPVSEAKVVNGTLTFRFQPGPRVACTLARQESGAYMGVCAGEDGMNATMVMVPPAKQEGPGQ